MRVLRVFGHDREAPVVIGNVAGQLGVGLLHVVYPRQAHFLDQPVLQGLVKQLAI